MVGRSEDANAMLEVVTCYTPIKLEEVNRIGGVALCKTEADHVGCHARELLNMGRRRRPHI